MYLRWHQPGGGGGKPVSKRRLGGTTDKGPHIRRGGGTAEIKGGKPPASSLLNHFPSALNFPNFTQTFHMPHVNPPQKIKTKKYEKPR